MNKILRYHDESVVLSPEQIKKAYKQLQKEFKDWFKNYQTPQILMPKHCIALKYSEELTKDAQYIVDNIHRHGTLEGCQPNTIVGVALYILNAKIQTMRQYSMYRKSEMEIAEAVNKSTQAIKEKYDRIKDLELYYIPKNWLSEREKHMLEEESRMRQE